jgi:hypothetical protein
MEFGGSAADGSGGSFGADGQRDVRPTIPDWHLFGCLDICKGNTANIRAAPNCGTAKPRVIFECPGCAKFFHADCQGMTAAQKAHVWSRQNEAARRQQAADAASQPAGDDFIAMCNSCVYNAHGVWRASQLDSVMCVEICRALSERKKIAKADLHELGGSLVPALDPATLRAIHDEYSKPQRDERQVDKHMCVSRRPQTPKQARPSAAHSPPTTHARLCVSRRSMLLSRQPQLDPLDEDLVAMMSSQLRKRAAVVRPRASSAAADAPNTTQRAAESMAAAVSKAPCLQKAKRRLSALNDADEAAESDEPDEPDGGGKPCECCGAAHCGRGSSKGAHSYKRHLIDRCNYKKAEKNLDPSALPMSSLVFDNTRRMAYQRLP